MDIERKGEYEHRHTQWFCELDDRPYHSNFLLKNGEVVLKMPTANRKFTIEEMINMYQARLMK